MRRRIESSVGALLAILIFALVPTSASAAEDGVAFRTVLDGRPVNEIDANEPLRLKPDRELNVRIVVENRSRRAVHVRTVRLHGDVLGLTFFDYTTRVDLSLPAGRSGTKQFALDLSTLSSEATGLLPARISLLDRDREVLAGSGFPVQVEGSLRSAYGIFALLVAFATLLLLGGALIRLAAGRLPENRWFRALRFAVPGMGLGLTFTFTLSAFKVLVPNPGAWLGLVVVCGLVGLVFGFLTPTPHFLTPEFAAASPGVIDIDSQPGDTVAATDIAEPPPLSRPAEPEKNIRSS